MDIETLFVPGLAARLFSVCKACEARASFTFDTHGSFIRRDSVVIPIEVCGSPFILSTVFSDDPSAVDLPPASPGVHLAVLPESAAPAVTTHPLTLLNFNLGHHAPGIWHSRCGHVGAAKLAGIRRSGVLGSFGTIAHEFCTVCVHAKMENIPHIWRSVPLATYAGDIVHTDVAGPFPRSVNGYQWMVNFVDSCSRAIPRLGFTATKDKVSVAREVEYFIMVVCRSRQITVRVLFSDNGPEYRNELMTTLSVKYCFRQEFTAPGTSAQNGLAERVNRTVTEMCRAMLFQSSAPLSLWTCAAATAVYFITGLPSTTLNGAISYTLWTGRSLRSLSHLRVWACPVLCKTDALKAKPDSRAREGIFVGYSTGTKCYRFYDAETRRFSESRNCIFDETFSTKRSVPAPTVESLSDFDYPFRPLTPLALVPDLVVTPP